MKGMLRSVEYEILSTTIYAIIGFGSLRAEEGKSASAVELLTLAIDQPVTPALYKDIGRQKLDELGAKLSKEEFEAAQERGRDNDLQEVVQSIIRKREID